MGALLGHRQRAVLPSLIKKAGGAGGLATRGPGGAVRSVWDLLGVVGEQHELRQGQGRRGGQAAANQWSKHTAVNSAKEQPTSAACLPQRSNPIYEAKSFMHPTL